MMMTMIQFIQKECDRQAREIFQHFRENRDFDHKAKNSFRVSRTHRHTSKRSELRDGHHTARFSHEAGAQDRVIAGIDQ